MTAEKLLHAWFENVWNRRDDDFVHQYMGRPCAIQGLPESAHNPEGFLEFRNNLQAGISKMHIKVLDSIGEEDRTIGTCCVTGIHTATQQPVEFCFAYTARVSKGKIVEANNIIDFLTMLQQTEIIPRDAVEKSMIF